MKRLICEPASLAAGSKCHPPNSHQSQRCSSLPSITSSYLYYYVHIALLYYYVQLKPHFPLEWVLFIQEGVHFPCSSEASPSFMQHLIFVFRRQMFIKRLCYAKELLQMLHDHSLLLVFLCGISSFNHMGYLFTYFHICFPFYENLR